jgi:hypothetical protein
LFTYAKELIMAKRLTTLLLTFALLLVAAPAMAAERVATLPSITPVTSAFLDFALAGSLTEPTTGAPVQLILAYGQGRVSGDRAAITFVDGTTGERLELIMIGERIFVRTPDQPLWVEVRLDDVDLPVADPAAPVVPMEGDLVIYRVGDATVRGVPTVQYQIPIDVAPTTPVPGAPAPEGITSTVIDMFVGTADSYLHKMQTTVRATDPDLGVIAVEFPIDFSRHNQPQVIEAPAPDQIVGIAANSMRTLRVPGGHAMPRWMRAVVGQLIAR